MRKTFTNIILLLSVVFRLNNARSDSYENWPVFRWDNSQNNYLYKDVITKVEDQDIEENKPRCVLQAATGILESRMLIQGFDNEYGFNEPSISKIGPDIFETDPSMTYWEMEGPMLEECTGEYYDIIASTEKCHKLPFNLKEDMYVPYEVNKLLYDDQDNNYQNIKNSIKSMIFNWGPGMLCYRQDGQGCIDKNRKDCNIVCGGWEKFRHGDYKNDPNRKVFIQWTDRNVCTPGAQHCVMLVGWNDNISYQDAYGDNASGAWLIKDSHGTKSPYNYTNSLPQDQQADGGFWWFGYFESHKLMYQWNDDFTMLVEKNINATFSTFKDNSISLPCIVYAKPEGKDKDETYGRSWEDAYGSIQDAVDMAAYLYIANGRTAPCQVWAKEGTYNIFNISKYPFATLFLKEGVALMGSFNGNENVNDVITNPQLERDVWPPRSILEGGGSSPHVVNASPNTSIDGFSIKGGWARSSEDSGGGIYFDGNVDGRFHVLNCIIEDNKAENKGGGINAEGGEIQVRNCIFRNNEADFGGGISNNNNTAQIFDSRFVDNMGGVFGGGIFNNGTLLARMERTTFSLNSAQMGGGIYNNNGSSIIIYCTFWENTADNGGAISLFHEISKIANTTINRNSSTIGDTGGIYCEVTSDVLLINSILWDNQTYEIVKDSSSVLSINYSDIKDADPMVLLMYGEGNISLDPMLVDPSTGDLRLMVDWTQGPLGPIPIISPCIDRGHEYRSETIYSIVPEFLDFYLLPQLETGVVEDIKTDMGAYDWKPPELIILPPQRSMWKYFKTISGVSQDVGFIGINDSNRFQPLGENDGKDNLWIVTNETEEKSTIVVRICPEMGDAILAFYSPIPELLDVTNQEGSGECEILSKTMDVGESVLIDVDTYGNNAATLGEYELEISWGPICGCHKDWITTDQDGTFGKYTLNGKAVAPWQFGVPTSGPMGCYGGSGSCWATNLAGNYNNSANECVETTAVDLSVCGGGTMAELSFMHWFNFETGYDGANVEAWDGTQWNVITPEGGYPEDSIRAPGTSVNGKPGYSSAGTENFWQQQTFYIQGYSNSDFKVRFCFGSDSAGKDKGWYVDDIGLKLYDGNCGGGCYDNLYSEDFETDNGGFSVDPNLHLNSTWEWGTPTGDPATGADGKVWATNVDGNYNTPEDSCVDSPVIDLSTCLPWQDVTLQLDQWYRFWHNLYGDTWDGAQVQAWDGTAWKMIAPEEGYPDIVYAPNRSLHNKPGFTDLGDYGVWHGETFDLRGFTNYDFQLRFCMSATYNPHPGWYIDNVTVQAPPAPNPNCAPGAILYSSDFEADNGGFTSGAWQSGGNNTWQNGIATSGPGSCHGGTGKCWATNLTGNYQNCEDSYIEKALDLSACGGQSETVYLVYWHWFEFETYEDSWGDTYYYDGYSLVWTDDGTTWSQPAASDFISEGFNSTAVNASNSGCSQTPWLDGRPGYENASGAWQRVVVPIPPEMLTGDFKLRLAAGADGATTMPGAYIDDVCFAVGDDSNCQ